MSIANTQILDWLALDNVQVTLTIEDDPEITTLPTIPNTVKRLTIYNCIHLTSIHELPSSLRHLQIQSCPALEILPTTMPPDLFFVSISSALSIRNLPRFMDALTHLFIEGAPELHTLPNLPSSLEQLYIRNTCIHNLPSTLPPNLTKLVIPDGDIESLPPLPDSLDTLYIQSKHLTELPPLPKSLRTLNVSNMIHLTGLPHPLPPFLNELYVRNTALTTLRYLPIHLRVLFLDSTPIRELPQLPPELNDLSLADTQISWLPELPHYLSYLNLENTPIKRLDAKQFNHIQAMFYLKTPTIINNFQSLSSNVHKIEFTNPDFQLLDLPIHDYLRPTKASLPVLKLKHKNIEIQPPMYATQESMLDLKRVIEDEMVKQKARIIQCTRAYKEDLMIKTWHPSRVEAWCGVRFDTMDD
jgi:hypothetical protein